LSKPLPFSKVKNIPKKQKRACELEVETLPYYVNYLVLCTITNMMRGMFAGASTFHQDISGWPVANGINHEDMFNNCPIDQDNKPRF